MATPWRCLVFLLSRSQTPVHIPLLCWSLSPAYAGWVLRALSRVTCRVHRMWPLIGSWRDNVPYPPPLSHASSANSNLCHQYPLWQRDVYGWCSSPGLRSTYRCVFNNGPDPPGYSAYRSKCRCVLYAIWLPGLHAMLISSNTVYVGTLLKCSCDQIKYKWSDIKITRGLGYDLCVPL